MAEKQNSSPKISVLIPVYKVEKYVGRCLRSLFANTIIADCEVIIVNDCSPDDSMKVVADVLEEFPAFAKNVVLRSHDCNRGLAAARNTALLQAHGKYIICVDSDDWVEPDYLEKLYVEAENSGADIVGCDLVREYKHRKEIFPIPLKKTSDENLRYLLLGAIPGWLHVKFIRASLFQNYERYWIDGINMCEDLLVSAKLFYYAKKISYVSKVLYHYECSNTASLSLSLSENKIKEIKLAYNELYKFLVEKGKRDRFQDELIVCQFRLANWILLSSVDIDKSYFDIFSKQKFYKNKYFSKFQKIYLFLCYHKLYFFPYFFIKLRRIRDRRK
ncbi:MAG: glycosyltransferase family 2 protein [Treponema sp.]|nr:glycosyltransferase family 2 protein [Treponema sp.]